MKAKAGVLGESSGRSLSKAVGPPSHCSSPFPQGLEAAHAAQHQLWVVLVGVHFLIIGHESIFPLVQLLIPGSLDLLPGRKERTAVRHREHKAVFYLSTDFPSLSMPRCMRDTAPSTVGLQSIQRYVQCWWGCWLLGTVLEQSGDNVRVAVRPCLSPSFPAQTQESPELQHVGMQGQGKSSGWQEALTRAPVRRPRPGSAGMLTVGRLAGPAAAFLMRPERPGHICIFAGGKQLAFQKLFILYIT